MGALTVEALKDSVAFTILQKRRTLRLVESQRFREVFASLSPLEMKLVEELVFKDDIHTLEAWMNKSRKDTYGEMPMRALRLVGQRLGVPNYQHLVKAILLSEIIRYEKAASPAQVR